MHSSSNNGSANSSADANENDFVLRDANGNIITFDSISSETSDESEDSEKIKITSGQPIQTQFKESAHYSNIENEVTLTEFFDKNRNFKCETFFDSFLLAEHLERNLPIRVDNEYLKNEVTSALDKDKKEVKMNFIIAKRDKTYQEKLQEIKNKKHSVLEDAKLLFNKVTLDKVMMFTKDVKELKFETVEEMKELASFVFGKVISEKAFMETYTKMISFLKKDFKCEEEKTMNKEQTCFFGTLLKLMMRKIKENHTFNKSTVVDKTGKKEAEIEAEIEIAELTRKTKRNQALGAVSFCVALYTNQVTGVTNIKTVLEMLTSKKSGESVELVCEILNLSGDKLVMKHRELVKYALDYVKSNNEFGPRIEIAVENTEKNIEKIIVATQNMAGVSNGNSFANMMVNKSCETVAKPKEVSQEEKIILFFEQEILSSITACHDLYDLDDFKDVIYNGWKQFDKDAFMFQYFVFCTTEHKAGKKLCDMYSMILKDEFTNVFDILQKVKKDLSMHYIDYPTSKIQYPVMLCHVRSTENISQEQFKELQVPDYKEKVKDLVYNWKKEEDERLEKVFTEEEIEKLTK